MRIKITVQDLDNPIGGAASVELAPCEHASMPFGEVEIMVGVIPEKRSAHLLHVLYEEAKRARERLLSKTA